MSLIGSLLSLLSLSVVNNLLGRFEDVQVMSFATVPNITPRAILNICLNRGVDITSLLSDVGMDHRLIEDPNARIPIEQVVTLWSEAQKRTGDEMIALHTAEHLPFGAYKVIDYLIDNSSTPREALNNISRYLPLITTAFELLLRMQKDQVHLELHDRTNSERLTSQYVEYIVTNILVRLRLATGVKWAPAEINLTYLAPRNIAEYYRLFQAPIRFNQPVNRLILDPRLLDIPQPHADPALCEVLAQHAERLLRQLPIEDDLISQLHETLREQLRRGDVSLATSARALATSRRALQRRLNSLGTSYREVLDQVRCELSVSSLKDEGVNIEDTAFLTRFSEPSAFYRAFKRWTGRTPQQYLHLSL